MTAATPAISLPLAFKALRMPTMARCWQDLATEATRESWSHERFLSALCAQEMEERTSRRLEARLVASRLPTGKRLDSFDFTVVPAIRRGQIEDLLSGDWVRSGGNILAFGGTGSGKTHCAAAIGYGLIEAGYHVLFTRTTDLVQRLQAARRDFSLPNVLMKMDRIDVMILDDIGYARKDPAETSVLFEIIAERYERKSLIITCDRPFAEWDTIFPDKIMTVAAIDRLVHHATILEFGAESYRLREATQRGKNSMSKRLSPKAGSS